MRTIETILTVDERGIARLQMPPDITPGEHKVVVVIEEELAPRSQGERGQFPQHDIGPWPFGSEETFRREDM